MAVVKLTARNIATLPGQSDRRVDYVDAILPGFTLRVSPRGSRTFAVRYFHHFRKTLNMEAGYAVNS